MIQSPKRAFVLVSSPGLGGSLLQIGELGVSDRPYERGAGADKSALRAAVINYFERARVC